MKRDSCCRAVLVLLILFSDTTGVDAFQSALPLSKSRRLLVVRRRRDCPAVTPTFRHLSNTSEWEGRNVYDDLDKLRASIAKHQAQDRLREFRNRQLLDSFAANRRPLWQDLRKFVLLPFVAAVFLAGTLRIKGEFARVSVVASAVARFEFWSVLVVAPIILWIQIQRNTRSVTTDPRDSMPPDIQRLDPEALEFYKQMMDVNEAKASDTVVSLLEFWISAVAGTGLMAVWLSVTNDSRSFAQLMPFLRFTTRLGAVASLHQYPKLLYDLRHVPKPMNRFESHVLNLSNAMLRFAVIGLSLDLSNIMLLTHPIVVLMTITLTPLAVLDLRQVISTSSAAMTWKGALQSFGVKLLGLLPCIGLGRLLWKVSFRRIKSTAFHGLLPVTVSALAPLIHIVALLRLVRISYTHDLSLANSSSRFILYNPSVLQRRMKLRWRLDWREPKRLRQALSDFGDDLIYRFFFAGGVPDKLLESKKRSMRQKLRSLLEEAFQLNGEKDSTESKETAMRNLAQEHQRDYDDGAFHDPLGVAVQQTFGIGLGYADGHMDPLSPKEQPSSRRLQARAAKSAIRRVQEIYDAALEEDFDSISDVTGHEARKAEIREREHAEIEFLTEQLVELVPQEDEGDFDDPAARVKMPSKLSIYQMLRVMAGDASQYDEPRRPTYYPEDAGYGPFNFVGNKNTELA